MKSTYYSAAWTDSGCFIVCEHEHETLVDAVSCIPCAGGYVVGIRNGVMRSLSPKEESEFQALMELHPDLVVLDHSMPVMNGLDAARELKRLMPTVPLIMYSMFSDGMEEQARLVGISELISKSQPAAILVSKVRSLLCRNAA